MNGHASFNRCYTLVWSEAHQTYVVTHEATRSKGKRSGAAARPLVHALLVAMTGMAGASGALAGTPPTTVVPVGGNTVAYVSPNGVPVVDINTANAAGLSHNTFTRYDVNPNGLVLNNGNTSQMARQSELAGQVMANTNLSNEARIILNEVISPNRSTLAGFTEVVGGKADVIVANPYGITCSGCGYINTDRVTLTTGTPTIGADGRLTGFAVKQGDILINGNGLNASAQQVLDLVARSVKLDGQINAVDLGVAAGANAWDYTSRSVTGAVVASGAVPGYAIDSTVLGGMYAGRIRLMATEAGVGVRMLGDAAATADDFTLNAAGQVELRNKISAQQDLRVSSTSTAAGAIQMNDASLAAKRDLVLAASQGGVSLVGSALVANNDLSLSADRLSDNASAATLADNNKRFAGRNLNVNVAQTADLNGTSWGAASALTATVGSLNVGSSDAQIYSNGTAALTATSGDLALNTAAVSAVNNLDLSANAGAIKTTAGAAQGVQSTAGNIALNAATGVDNAGVMDAKAGNITVRANGNSSNSGTLHASGNVDFADKSGGQTANLSNTGTLLAEANLSAKAVTLTNTGSMQGTTGSTITATNVDNSGLLVASGAAGNAGSITATKLTNTGTIQSAQDLALNLSNELNNSGKLLAQRDLSVASGAAAATLTNTAAGVIQSGGALSITGSQTNFATQAGVLLGNTAHLDLATLNNSGTLQSDAAMVVKTAGALNNSGTVLAKTTQTAALGSLNNSGVWQANQSTDLTVNAALVNSGVLLAATQAGGSGRISTATLDNQGAGVIQAAQNLDFEVSGTSFKNAGKILAVGGSLGLSATGGSLQWDNLAGAYVQAGGTLGQSGPAAVTLSNQASANILANQINVSLAALNNAGTLQGGTGASVVNVTNTLTNSGTLSLASNSVGSGSVIADTLTNTGQLQSQGAVTLNIGTQFTNSGKTLAAGNLTVTGKDASYSINNTGHLESLAALTLQGQSGGKGVAVAVGKTGVLKGKSMLVKSTNLTVQGDSASGGMVNTSEAMTLTLDQLNFGGSKSRVVAGTGASNIVIASAYNNVGAIHAAGDLIFKATSITNTATGGLSAGGNLVAQATQSNFDNRGALYAGKNLTVSAANTITNYATATGPQGTMDASGDITISATNFTNQSTVNAIQNITINLGSGSFRNDVAGDLTRKTTKTNYSAEDNYKSTSGWCTSCGYNPVREFYRQTWDEVESFVNFNPATAFKPQIISGSGSTLTIAGFSNGSNKGGVISGGTVQLAGASPSSTFVVDALTLVTQYKMREWNTLKKWYGVVGAGVSSDSNIENDTGPVQRDPDSAEKFGAGIFATASLGLSGFGLSVAGSPTAGSVTPESEGGTNSASLVDAKSSTTPNGSNASDTAATAGAAAVSFPGLAVTLPSNPNGYFVSNQNPNAQYLVETNPLFAVGSNFVGSNYLAERYGYNPDEIGKRLGDSDYEAYLIRQQLIAQTGNNILNGQADEAAQMQALMDNAAKQGKGLGLVWGRALNATQAASLKNDIVWMVEISVGGQKVLAPVVYLSKGTKAAIETGAVISAKDANLNLTSLTNSGGTISGSSTLNIVSKDDVLNLSGTIKGGDVSVQSTEGSIRNQTQARTSGDVNFAANTAVDKTGGIQATGNLSLDAAKDIVVKGGQVTAGRDASLSAGRDVTFDTIEDKSANTTFDYSSNGLTSTSNKTTTTSTTQIKSGLTVGGNLSVKAKNDITLAGTDVSSGGNLDLDAGKDLNILARANSTKTTSITKTSGMGVGGGIAGSQETDAEMISDRNVGSNIKVGGNASLKAKKDITIEGSNLAAKGSGEIDAGENFNILDGKDRDYSKTTTTTTTFLKVEKGQSKGGSKTATESETGAKAKGISASAGASIGASAEAENKSSGGLVLAQKTVETQTDEDVRGVGSKVGFGGDLTVTAGKDVTLRGSELSAGGDADVDANNVNVLAGQNKKTSANTNSTTKVGLMADSTNKAKVSAGASAGAKAGVTGANASAVAEASAEVSSENRLALVKVSKTTEDALDITHNASAIKSGGNMKIKAKEGIKTVGSALESGGDMDLQAKDMSFEDAQDVHEVKRTSDETSAGLYLDASAKASASVGAQAKVGGLSMDAKGSAKASATVEGSASAGLYGSNTRSGSTEGSTKAQVSSLKSGGSMKRTATNEIKDVGTNIEAGGDFEQSATSITSLAARDTTYATSNEETNTAKIGAYVEGSGGVSAEANGSAGGMGKSAGKSSGAGAGVKASFEQNKEDSSSSSSTAVVSTIKAGGKIKSKSSGATDMEGTQLKSGGDTELEADTLNYRAAANTTSESSNSRKIGVELKVDIVNKGGSLEGSYGKESGSSSTSEAVVGGIDAGGALKIKTKGDARLEGTQIMSGGDSELDVGGNLRMDAARNTQTSDGKGLEVTAGISGSKSGKSKSGALAAEGGYNESHEEASQAVVGNVLSGGKLKIKTGGDASFEGTNIGAQGDTELDAKGKIDFAAARDTEKTNSLDVSASLGASYGKEGASRGTGGRQTGASSEKGGSLGVGVGKAASETSTATGGTIASGGKLKITSGSDARFEGTDISAAGDASVAAKGDLNFDAAKSTHTDNSLDVSAGVSGRKGSGLASRSTEAGGTGFGRAGKGTQNGTRTEAAGNLGVGVGKAGSTTAVAGGIRSGGNLSLASGGNTTLEGTQVAADGKAAINAGGKVDFKAAESTSSNLGVEVAVGGKMLRTTGAANAALPASNPGLGTLAKKGIDALRKPAPGQPPRATPAPSNPAAPRTAKEITANIGVDVGSSKTSEVGSIKAGQGIQINSGQDMTLVGTQLNGGAGGVALTSGGAVNLQAAENSSKSTSVGLEMGKVASGPPDDSKGNQVRVNAASSSQGVKIEGQGDLNINAAGALKMEGAKADMGGNAHINAAGGVTQKAAAKDSQSSKGLGGDKPKSLPQDEKKPDTETKETEIKAKNTAQQNTAQQKTVPKDQAELASKLAQAAEVMKKAQAAQAAAAAAQQKALQSMR